MAKVTNNTGKTFRGSYLHLKAGQAENLPIEQALDFYGVLKVEFDSDDSLENISVAQKRMLTKSLGENFTDGLIPKKSGLGRAKKAAKKTVEAILPEAAPEVPEEPEETVETIE